MKDLPALRGDAPEAAASPLPAAASHRQSRQLLIDLCLRPILTQRRLLVGIALSLAVQAASDGTILLLVRGFVKALFQDPGRSFVPLGELFTDRIAPWLGAWQDLPVSRPMLALVVPLGLLAGGCLRAGASYLYQLHSQALALFVAKQYRERLFAALLAMPYAEIRRRQVGEWMSLIMNDVMFLQSRFSDMLTGLVRDTATVAWCFVYLAFLHWPTALVLAVVSPVIALGMGRTGRRIAGFAEAFQREMARIAAAVLDLRARFDFIRAQWGEDRERRRFAALNLGYYRMIRRSILVRSAFAPLLEFVGIGFFALVMYGVASGRWGAFKPDVMLTFFAALGLLLKPLREMGEQLSRFHETIGTLRLSLALFGDVASRSRAAVAKAAKAPSAPVDLVIRRITAGMDGTPRFAAERLSLLSGRAVAIVGPSGGGKSTLLKTLAGLVPPLDWDANIDWHEAAGLVSMVSQEPFLFDDTVAANLAYGHEGADVPASDAVWAALATVNIQHEVEALPEGLATRLRAIGSNVSGGQLQRLVIARSLLRRKPIWLLDEATSAVDAKSERDITKRLIAACHAGGQALLAVTHRLTWLDAFDEVWFVEAGRVALVGPHAALLGEPRYRAYCEGSATAEGAGDDAEA